MDRTRLISRWIAWLIDITIFFSIINYLTPLNSYFHLPYGFQYFPTYLLWTFIQAILLSTWGTTPGKWLFGISIQVNGNKLPFLTALKRSFLLFLLPMGVGNMILLPVSQLILYQRYKKREVTYWDKVCDTTVTYTKIGVARASIIGMLLLIYIVQFGLTNSDQLVTRVIGR